VHRHFDNDAIDELGLVGWRLDILLAQEMPGLKVVARFQIGRFGMRSPLLSKFVL
jgi:hypothetical protein